ncbi:hypothetical protein FQA39_LY06835 [Lamprigera yunnana]|nr:hypothetical protein FQA39_LY06835 [Lamprigera yunnana]
MEKVIYAALCLVSVAFAENIDERQKAIEAWEKVISFHEEECLQESGADENLVNNAFRAARFPDDYNFKCFFKCHYFNLGFMDKEGNFNEEVILNRIHGGDTHIMKVCENVAYKEIDLCNRTYAFINCGMPMIFAKYV